MYKNTYTLISKFECCRKAMVTVIMDGRAACVISQLEYNKIIEAERKFEQMNGLFHWCDWRKICKN